MRREIIKIRDSIPPDEKERKDELIRKELTALSEYKDARTVLMFASFRSEVQTYQMINDALTADKTVILPKVNRETNDLDLFSIHAVDELKSGYMGIPEPAVGPDRTVDPDDIDFIMMPGVAFDEQGGRLGYGGGYYDRLIGKMKRRPPLVAVAYDEQLTGSVPVTAHDVRPDKIVTDTRTIDVDKN